jgi:hypothetical protein
MARLPCPAALSGKPPCSPVTLTKVVLFFVNISLPRQFTPTGTRIRRLTVPGAVAGFHRIFTVKCPSLFHVFGSGNPGNSPFSVVTSKGAFTAAFGRHMFKKLLMLFISADPVKMLAPITRQR